MEERIDPTVLEWARQIPGDQIPGVLTFLSARLLNEGFAGRAGEHSAGNARNGEKLLTADELAERLGVPESWVRTEERAGRIPGFRLGKYVRFKLSDVERALAKRQDA